MRNAFDETELVTLFAHFHGMIVEYVKRNSKGKQVTTETIR